MMFVQVGVTALRDPKTGEFLPAVPIYREESEETVAGEAAMIRDAGKLLMEKFKQYIDGGGFEKRRAV